MGRIVIAAALCAALIATSCDEPHQMAAPAAIAPAPPATETTARFPVGVREFRFARGPGRPLRTLVLFPAMTTVRDHVPAPAPGTVVPRPGAIPRPGRYPLVLFSHGLHGSPERYAPAVASWAAAGFVLAIPAYPYTNKTSDPYRRTDIENQPADAAYVLRRMIRLATLAGEPLRGHIDTSRIGAVGHSAGGYTTTGLLRAGHDPRIRAGVVIAGWLAPGAYGGAPARMLFVHADNDVVIPIADGRAAFDRAPWPKTFAVLPGMGHAAYMLPGRAGYAEMDRLVTDFLLRTLGGVRR